MNQKKLLVLVDGSAVFHRGYHAIPHLSNKDGEPTNAVYGFATILLKVMGDLKPDYLVIAWDKSSQTFRKELYPEYKATRKKQPDDLYAQIPATRELAEAIGHPMVELDNYEADDIIGTLARQAEERGDLDIVIATGDKDQLQLVDKSTIVAMFNPRGMEPTRYDLAKMQEKYGLTPHQFIDYKALVGDPSDNIPGVAGIGDVGAKKLLHQYKSLDGIYEHLDEITGSLHDKLAANKEMAYLSYKLSVIVCDAPVQLDLKAAAIGQYDRDHVQALFHRLDFRSLLAKLPAQNGGAAPSSVAAGELTLFGDGSGEATKPAREHLKRVQYRAVTTAAALDELVANLTKQPVFAFDTETDSVDTTAANLVGLSFSFKEAEAYYIPVGHLEGEQLARDAVLAQLKPIMENAAIGKVGHNLKFDYEILRRYDIFTAGIAFDTMIAAFLLNSLGRAQSLDDVAYGELGIEMIPISEMIGTGKAQVTFAHTAIDEAVIYAAEDADMAWRLYLKLKDQLHEYAHINEYGWSMERLATDVEWPLIPVLGEMEIAGIELDVPFLEKLGAKLEKRIGELKTKVYDLAGEEFNLGSPAQLSQILYGRLGLSAAGIKKGKTGISTAAGELEKLRQAHPIVPLIMEYRELDKLKNTYIDALPGQVKADGRVHTSFSQVIAQTGRLSSNNPNLMNIPVRTELGREVRQAFVAPAGRVLVSADYSQIELRVAAALSGDQAMIDTFKAGEDLHQRTAAEIFGVRFEEVTKEQRYSAKAINFGVLYGMSAHGLSVATGADMKEAAGFIERYFQVRPQLRTYLDGVKKFAQDNLYTTTLFGRRRACPEIRSSNFVIRQGAERMAVNVPLQGTAADIYKLAMIAVADALDDDCQLLLQIHDELIVEAPEAKAEAVAQQMAELMGGVIDLGVPLAVDTAIGQRWGEL
ncbi:MAG TPA: DNA polymerase I [Candidatus Saccharimonadia bacterium]|nr:DNA polymerase I [Candidatus Saccharimonadia bacterium]